MTKLKSPKKKIFKQFYKIQPNNLTQNTTTFYFNKGMQNTLPLNPNWRRFTFAIFSLSRNMRKKVGLQ